MRTGYHHKRQNADSAVTSMIEYLMVSGVCMVFLIVMLLLINANIMENPANRVTYVAFTDIGNGVSTRMVDVYSIAPANGTVTSRFDIPDEIVGRDYSVEIVPGAQAADQDVIVSREDLNSRISLAGIGATLKGTAGGNTTGAGMNTIRYDSRGGL
ncbi:MAG: hypothetical protein WC586_07705 [Methanoregula sp.]